MCIHLVVPTGCVHFAVNLQANSPSTLKYHHSAPLLQQSNGKTPPTTKTDEFKRYTPDPGIMHLINRYGHNGILNRYGALSKEHGSHGAPKAHKTAFSPVYQSQNGISQKKPQSKGHLHQTNKGNSEDSPHCSGISKSAVQVVGTLGHLHMNAAEAGHSIQESKEPQEGGDQIARAAADRGLQDRGRQSMTKVPVGKDQIDTQVLKWLIATGLTIDPRASYCP